jgi:hypothetical protein
MQLDLVTANPLLQMDGVSSVAVTAVAWPSKRNRYVRHEKSWRERSHKAALAVAA